MHTNYKRFFVEPKKYSLVYNGKTLGTFDNKYDAIIEKLKQTDRNIKKAAKIIINN